MKYEKHYATLWHEIFDDWFWHVGELPDTNMSREELIKQLWGLDPPSVWSDEQKRQQLLETTAPLSGDDEGTLCDDDFLSEIDFHLSYDIPDDNNN
jgi:hypothetical protein